MEANATWDDGLRFSIRDDRGHSIVVDQPTDEGGSDRGTSPTELLVFALAGCILTIFRIVAKKRRLDVRAMNLHLVAERPSGAATITAVRGEFHVESAANAEDIATVLRLTVRSCPVGVLFDRAGIPVDVRITVQPPKATAPVSLGSRSVPLADDPIISAPPA
jgi:putative redox protein